MKCDNCGSTNIEVWGNTNTDNGYKCRECGQIVENGTETRKGVNQILFALVKEHSSIEKEILESLPEGEVECRCEDNYDTFEYIHWGNHFPEIMSVCLRCGGMKEIREGI